MQTANDRPLFSFAIIADTHITADEGLAPDSKQIPGRNVASKYSDIIERINALKPDFVVHLGDVAHPTPSEPHYDAAAHAFHKASEILSMPLYLVPGNHDMGEKLHAALPDLDAQISITNPHINLYERHFGSQHHSFKHKDCLFITVNSLLINSGLKDEQKQWNWLEETLQSHAGDRVFIFSHYPLYLTARDEPDHYDSIDEPGRSRMLDLLRKYPVEGFYAGHVHNLFYNHLDGMHQFVLPSTSIIRHDYLEYFRTPPSREIGRYDPAKTGFFWIEIFENDHVPYLIRTAGDIDHVTHSWRNNGISAMMDLRMPWCDEADIATPWAVEIFERKIVRNDYPLSALWEMGIKEFRIPVTDILNPKTVKRVKELIGLGHRFSIVMFGVPNEARQAALASLGKGIKSIEIVGLLNKWGDLAAPLATLKEKAGYKIYLNAVRSEVQGWTTHHGLHVDLPDEVKDVLSQTVFEQSVDGFVFGVRQDVRPFDGAQAVKDCLRDTGYEFVLHVPCVGFDRTSARTDEASRIYELTRTAEAAMLARVNPDVSVVLDNFVELDRGYFNCRGLVDRLYNPKDGGRIMSSLDRNLPGSLSNPIGFDVGQYRIISTDSNTGHALLIVANEDGASSSENACLHLEDIADKQGKLVDLITGKSEKTKYRDLIEELEADSVPSPTMLFVVDR